MCVILLEKLNSRFYIRNFFKMKLINVFGLANAHGFSSAVDTIFPQVINKMIYFELINLGFIYF